MPFRLINDALIPEGASKVDKETFYTNHLGKGRFQNIENAISKWAAQKNIPMLAMKAGQVGGQKLQVPVLCGIFKANLEDSKDIADMNVLAEIAEAAGMMSKDEVRPRLLLRKLPDINVLFRP
ncbi:hypothetical protein C0992_005816 [Termitomyces sp. T32_za158]|nr:hypothetical protein C0992_005816 [Termitomyces sp. T32_za158]